MPVDSDQRFPIRNYLPDVSLALLDDQNSIFVGAGYFTRARKGPLQVRYWYKIRTAPVVSDFTYSPTPYGYQSNSVHPIIPYATWLPHSCTFFPTHPPFFVISLFLAQFRPSFVVFQNSNLFSAEHVNTYVMAIYGCRAPSPEYPSF